MKEEYPICFLKYEGPGLTTGAVSASKLGNVLIGVDNALQKLIRRDEKLKGIKINLEVEEARRGSFEVILTIITVAYIAEKLGILEFTKNFIGEIGTQLALKIFSKNKKLEKSGRPIIENGRMVVNIININGETKEINLESFHNFEERLLDKELRSITDILEKDKVESFRYGYRYEALKEEVYVSHKDKEYFEISEAPPIDLEEDFDENIAEDIPPIKGKLVSYQALATKYPFQFQPREKQELYGKRFITCILSDESKRDDYIELMKSHVGDLVIHGRGIKDKSGLYRKIKITSIEKYEQLSLFE